jgi:hypothetical protein
LSTVDSDDPEYFTITTQNKPKSLGERMDRMEAKVNHHDLPAMDHHLSNLQRLIEVLTHLEMIATSVKELSNNPRNILSDAEQKQLLDVFKLCTDQISGDCGTLCPATSRHISLRWKRIPASVLLRSHRDNL